MFGDFLMPCRDIFVIVVGLLGGGHWNKALAVFRCVCPSTGG